MREFLQGSRELEFALEGRSGTYAFLERVLRGQRYAHLGKTDPGVIRQYLIKRSGLRRAQITRLIQRCNASRQVRPLPAKRPSFPRRQHFPLPRNAGSLSRNLPHRLEWTALW